ncbi:DHHW family protein [Halobacillus sp. SY10]|uniref:DHHW family protein n=1 Tax=Halobacillus sp. SY10 TaxID=3381356 RepID=UPI0038799C00
MKKITNLLVAFGFLSMIFIIAIYVVITPNRETSYIENRSLAAPPPLEKEQFISGGFMGQFENFFTDQFPLRDEWLKAYLHLQSSLGKTFLMGYYVSDNGWITTEPKHSYPKSELSKGAEKVSELYKRLEEKEIDFYYVNTPHKVSNMQFLLPEYIERGAYDQVRNHFLSSLDEDIPKLDMIEQFNKTYTEAEMKNLFFKTDHHWNAKGAFKGYQMIVNWLAEQQNEEPARPDALQVESYEEKCLPDKDFVGSFNRQLYLTIDTVENKCAYTPKDQQYNDYVVEINGKKSAVEDVYGRAFHREEEEVYYSTLHTRDYREMKITNPDLEKDGERILIIKDSYANALSFLLAQQFYETTYYDPRHNRDRSLLNYIDQHDFDLVVMMYNDPSSDGAIYEYAEPTN